jgi:hypothetical protein
MSGRHRHDHSVIDVARRVAEGATGSGDPVADDLVAWLRWRIEPAQWQPGTIAAAYEYAVRTMAIEALALHDWRNP